MLVVGAVGGFTAGGAVAAVPDELSGSRVVPIRVLSGTLADAGVRDESAPGEEVASSGGLAVLRLRHPPVFLRTWGPLVRHYGGGQPQKTPVLYLLERLELTLSH